MSRTGLFRRGAAPRRRSRRPSAARLAFLCLLAFAWSPAGAAAAEQPNVLLVVVDTLRADHLGCYGYARPTSPRLDALAASGARFAAARSTSSWTAPSTASILTALYPVSHGVQLPGSRLASGVSTMASAFRAAGYSTFAHSANPAFVSPRQRFDDGFDLFTVLHGGPPKGDDDVDIITTQGGGKNALKVANAEMMTTTALETAAGADAAKPIFLFLMYIDPHGGYYPPVAYAERFGVDADSPLLTRRQQLYWTELPGEEDLRTLVSLYDGEIAFTDAQIGRLIDGLPRARPWLIVVTADHGEEFMEHGGMSHARTLYDESVRVPLIVAGPGVSPGVVAKAPVSIADVWPTVAEMAGLPAPADVEGRSLAATVRGGGEPAPKPVFADMLKANKRQEMLHRHAIVDGEWKLLQNMVEGAALFDLAADPAERHDILPEDGARAASLQTILAAREPTPSRAWTRRRRPAPTVALTEQDKERMRSLGYDPD